jgi:AraC-like DNA-binding protein
MKVFHEIRNYDANFKVWHTLYSNISFMAHWHKEIELVYVRSGTLEINITNCSFIVKKGDFIFIDSGEIHYSPSSDTVNCVDFILFDQSILSPGYQTSGFCTPVITGEMLEEYGIEAQCKQLINTVIAELDKKEVYYQDIIKAALQKFWYLLKRRHPRYSAGMNKESRHLYKLDAFLQMLTYIEDNCRRRITLENAAGLLHFSMSHFSKTFKSIMGISFVSYVNMVRIEHAINLLSTSPKILDVALESGFDNIRTFNRVFKQITGYTPSEFTKLEDPKTYVLGYNRHKENDSIVVKNDSTMLLQYIREESVPIE